MKRPSSSSAETLQKAQIHLLRIRLISRLALLACLMMNVGCQTFTTSQKWKWPWDTAEDVPQIPDRILPIWTDTIMHQQGKPGVRGFGGRIYFYASDETDAVEIDGGLVVYVFDTDKMDPHSPLPEKKYVFPPEHMKKHMSEAPLGKSYSVWLPWDEVGGESRSLTIVTRFEGTNGGVVLSQPAVKFLPGLAKAESKPNDSITATATGPGPNSPPSNGVSLAGYQETSPERQSKGGQELSFRKADPRRRETQTIDLPPSFHRHLNAPPGSPLGDPFKDKSTSGSVGPEGAEAPNTTNPIDASAPGTTTTSLPATSLPATSAVPLGTYNLLRYPFRRTPGMDTPTESNDLETTVTKSHPNRREPMKGGWIESLPRTPRNR